MGGHRTVFATLALLFPAVWWMAEVVPPHFYLGWNHDPRFFEIYLPGLLVTRWLSERTGRWVGQGYAVVLQDFVVALLLSVPAAILLSRWSRWQGEKRLRLGVGLASLTLPWFGVVRPWHDAEPYSTAVFALVMGYFGCLAAATFVPQSRGLRRALQGIALVSGATLMLWRLDPWEWLYAGSLVASLLLLAYATIRSRLVGGEAA